MFRFQLKLGEGIAMYGFPYADLLAAEGNFTLGNVTATTGLGGDTRNFQMSAPTQHGNSGGPVLDMTGRVVGVAVATLNAVKMANATGSIPQNVNFAISAPIAVNFMMVKDVAPVTSSSAASNQLPTDKITNDKLAPEEREGFPVMLKRSRHA